MRRVREIMYRVLRVGISHSSSSGKGDGNIDEWCWTCRLRGQGSVVVELNGGIVKGGGEESFLSLVISGVEHSEVIFLLLLHGLAGLGRREVTSVDAIRRVVWCCDQVRSEGMDEP